MLMNLPDPQSKQFSVLINEIENGDIRIPQFQRDFVWSLEKARFLMDSIIKGYPIGTFIFWRTKERLRSIKKLGNLEFQDLKIGEYINFVLDGQQRLTTLYACINGITIKRFDPPKIDNFAEMFVDLNAGEDEPIIITDIEGKELNSTISIVNLLKGDLEFLSKYPKKYHKKLSDYQKQIQSYNFSVISIKEASIDVATEIFTRINIGGVPLSLPEIMVAKTFDNARNFDLSERFDALYADLENVNYETISETTILQIISTILTGECTKKKILKIEKDMFIDTWEKAISALKDAVEYFRNNYRIPVSQLLPYDGLLVPFSYFFYHHPNRPSGLKAKLLSDFFWRVAISERYSQSLESRLSQDIKRIDKILRERKPIYDWIVDYSPHSLIRNGGFSTSRSFVKAILSLYTFQEPKSFKDDSIVRLDNEWLKRANSKNYHHFFPKDFLKKKGVDEERANNVLNITIVEDSLNKGAIKNKPPSKYISEFKLTNPKIKKTLESHIILDLEGFGILNDDYETFILKRAEAVQKLLSQRILPSTGDIP